MDNKYLIPQQSKNEHGGQRRVGFELEFGDIELEKVAEIVQSTVPGKKEKKSEMEFVIKADEFGDFKVELDWQLGKKIAEKRAGKSFSETDGEEDTMISWLKWLAGQLVPVEIICPPISIDKLEKLNELVDRLRGAGATGTDESYFYAFGVHINPEIPSASAYSIAKYLQAFSLAQEWLQEKNEVDPVRRITPYINAYPTDYLDLVFTYDKEVTCEQMIKDYLEHNPTRNRALDMLPLWMHLDEKVVQQFELKDTLTQARPTFHYRLPNCEIDREGWYLSKSWNIWCVVEHLATDEQVLADLIALRQEHDEKTFLNNEKQCHRGLEKIYQDLLSA